MNGQNLNPWFRDRVHHSPLVGRERDIARIRQVLAEPGTRLVTLTGPGGVGKTRVAFAIAFALAEATPESARPVVELASITDSSLILPAIAAAIGLEHTASGPLLDALAHSLGVEPGVLILDNLEHLSEAPGVVAQLLRAVPGLRLLATSRRRLHLTGEIVIELPPLAVPAAGEQPDHPDRLADFSAIELFIQRSREQFPWFELTAENADAVAEITRRLQGLPLAIELITSRARTLSLQDMLARLENPLPLLNAPRPDAPARQWTMQASIEWSVNLLAPSVREALFGLAVFPGSFDLTAAAAVAGADAHDVEALLDHHLLQLVDWTAQSHRFMLLEAIKQFGLERLRVAGDEARQRDRHAAYVLALVEDLEPNALRSGWEAARRTFDLHLDDCYAALAWALERHDAETAVRMFGAVRPFWQSRVPWETAYLWLQRVLAVIDLAALESRPAARFFVTAGLIAYHAGQLRESDGYHGQAVECARQAGDADTLAYALSRQGQTLRGLGDLDRAAPLMSELRVVIDTITDHAVRFYAYNELGAQAMVRRDYDAAWESLQQALASTRALSHPGAEGVTLHFLGYVAALRGDYDVARTVLHRALTFKAAGSESEHLSTLHALGRTELLAGQPAEAARWTAEALAGRHRRDDRLQVRICLIDLGLAAVSLGQAETAARWFGAADIAERLAEPHRFFVNYWRSGIEAARAALGGPAYEQAYRRGQLMAIEEAVEEALSFAADPPSSTVPSASPAASNVPPPHRLTARELDVLRLLVDGASDREIAEALFISPGTATRHVKNILHKLSVPSRTAAATLAVRRGIIAPGD